MNLKLNSVILKKEDKFLVALDKAIKFVLSKEKLGVRIFKSSFINDEPKLFSYTVNLNKLIGDTHNDDGLGSGTAISAKKALMKALGESIERYCISICNYKTLTVASYKDLKKEAINIFKFIKFSPDQLKDKRFKYYLFNEKSKFKWVSGFSLKDNKKVLIPAQLVYVPYKFGKEMVIRDPITTGAAASTSLGGAIYRGICEIIERDAFMITYLNNLTRESVDLEFSNPKLKKMFDICKRYRLELKIIDITTDLGIRAMMGIIIDLTGLGPAISIGLSSDLDPVIAAIGAAEEAFHTRPWIRNEMMKQNKDRNVNNQIGRGLFWSDPKMIKKCDFLFNDKKNKHLKQKYKLRYTPEKLKKVLSILINKFNYNVYFMEVTTPEVKNAGFIVVKVIIPELQPLYLDDRFPYLGGERLSTVPAKLGFKNIHKTNLNKLPHPFL